MKYLASGCIIVSLSFLMGADGNGCTAANILSLRSPPAIIPAGNPQNTLNRSFAVDLSAYPETNTLSWEFGDGAKSANLTVGQGRNVQHQFIKSGTFVVIVHLFNGGDIAAGTGPKQIAVGSLPVTVTGPNTLPTASFTVQDISSNGVATSLRARRFDASASRDPDGSITSFAWDFGDGQTDTGQVVDHTFATSGHFNVLLTVTDDRGGTATLNKNVLVNAAPTSIFTFTTDTTNTLTVHFDGSASSDIDGTITSFSWDFGDQSAAVTTAVATHTYAAPGTFSVKFTVTDDLGATGASTQSVTVQTINPVVQSITPTFGEVDTNITPATIAGQNFAQGAVALLRRGSTTITGTTLTVASSTSLTTNFDLHSVPTGDYDVVVQIPGKPDATLPAGFRVVTTNMVRLTTTMGDIVLTLVPDAPITTDNFLQYVEATHYDGTIFHRVVPNFVVQGGGLLPDGSQKPGLRGPIRNEFSPSRSNIRGTVAMAKVGSDPNSATDQFFVNLADNSANLDNQNGGFTVFANVTTGMDVVDAIGAVPTDSSDRPLTDVIITSARRE